MNRFMALDVETANADYSTICQIGLVEFRGDDPVNSWTSFINPDAYFDPYNTSIHGITPEVVSGAPRFSEIFDQLSGLLTGAVVLHHGHFDRTAFARSYDKFNLDPIKCSWLDNTKVVRRFWQEFQKSGYGLANLAKHLEITLDHHDALSDAKAAGQIFSLALHGSGLSVDKWIEEVEHPITAQGAGRDFRRAGDQNAPFFGEKIVFTGALRVNRSTAADVAQELGFDVQNGVTKKTTFLCVGIQDSQNLAGCGKSSKHRKAEQLAQEGHGISILSEDDFWAIARAHDTGKLT